MRNIFAAFLGKGEAMAKRKRLPSIDPAGMSGANPPAPETKALLPRGPDAAMSASTTRHAPIADIAMAATATAALKEVADELRHARENGLLVQALRLEQIDVDYLVRDRVALDAAEMATLQESMRERGQQSPIEVTALPDGRYGLISGWRRLSALKALYAETQDEKFGVVLAILRKPDGAAAAYLAMVEENEIRAGLSFYERARIVSRAVEQGVYPTHKAGLQALFGAVPRSRRSKIGSFLPIVTALDAVLMYPSALSERLGLRLSKALRQVPGFGESLSRALERENCKDAAAELAVIKHALDMQDRLAKGQTAKTNCLKPEDVVSGIQLAIDRNGAITLRGTKVDTAFRQELIEWLKGRQ